MIRTGTGTPLVSPVLLIRIHRIHMFLGLLDPDTDPSVRGTDPNLDPDPLVRGMDPRIQIRIHHQNVMDPQHCPLDVASVADPGSGAFVLTPGSGKGKNQDPEKA
jgi:hypothetical protein